MARLESESDSERAWGAFYAGMYSVKHAVPRLIELLRMGTYRGEATTRENLNALIELGATVPPDALVAVSCCAPEVAILRLRRPAENKPVFENDIEHRNCGSTEWLAAVAGLAATHSRRLAPVLLRNFRSGSR